jgi:tripartite ATP-independent transporter DctM subunit
MARIAIPEMTRYGYHKGLATGVVASAGTLGSMIPPSIGFILYGIFAEVSISKLFIAGILPGLLTAAIYAIMIVTRCRLNPKIAPTLTETVTWADRLRTLGDVWPVCVLMIAIIGGLYSGIATPTEVGAVGAFAAFLIALVQRRLTWKVLVESLLDALESSARIFFIAVGAVMLTRFLAMTGFGNFMTHAIGGWAQDPLLLVIAASIIYLILGMFLDPLGVLLLSLPLLLPMFEALHLNLIWFGVLVVKYVEIGLLTPPVGLNVYMVKSVVGDEIELETIFRGAGWFLACEVVIVILLVSFPEISLFLPSLMK